MGLKLFNKVNDKKYTISIHGEIGDDINGYYIADDIRWLNKAGVEEIEMKINSIGGDVYQSYSIMNEMRDSTAKITTINIGVAYSAASYLLASGHIRKAMNYSSGMIHDASGGNKNAVDIATNAVCLILSEKTGKDIEDVKAAMKAETWLTADDQKEFGLVDEVIGSGKEPSNITDKYKLMNYYKEQDIQTNTIKMDKVANKLGLDSKASESEILLKIGEVENAHGLALQALKTENSELVSKNSTLEATAKEVDARTIDSTFNKACEDGKYKKEDKEAIIALANKLGTEGFNTMVSAMAIPHVDVNNLIGGASGVVEEVDADGKKIVKNWAYYEKNDPKELLKIERENPTLFNKLKEADEKLYK